MSGKVVKPFLHLFFFKYLNIYLFFLPKGFFINNYYKYLNPLYFYKTLKPVKTHMYKNNLIILFTKKTPFKNQLNSVFNYFYTMYNNSLKNLLNFNTNVAKSKIQINLTKFSKLYNTNWDKSKLNIFNKQIITKIDNKSIKTELKKLQYLNKSNNNKLIRSKKFNIDLQKKLKTTLQKKLNKLHQNNSSNVLKNTTSLVLANNYKTSLLLYKYWGASFKFYFNKYNLMTFSKFQPLAKFFEFKQLLKLNNSLLNKKIKITKWLKKLTIFKSYFKILPMSKLIFIIKLIKNIKSNKFETYNNFVKNKTITYSFFKKIYKMSKHIKNLLKKQNKTNKHWRSFKSWKNYLYNLPEQLNNYNSYKFNTVQKFKNSKKLNKFFTLKYVKSSTFLFKKMYNKPQFLKHKYKNIYYYIMKPNKINLRNNLYIKIFKQHLKYNNLKVFKKTPKIWITPTYEIRLINHEYVSRKVDWRPKYNELKAQLKNNKYKITSVNRHTSITNWLDTSNIDYTKLSYYNAKWVDKNLCTREEQDSIYKIKKPFSNFIQYNEDYRKECIQNIKKRIKLNIRRGDWSNIPDFRKLDIKWIDKDTVQDCRKELKIIRPFDVKKYNVSKYRIKRTRNYLIRANINNLTKYKFKFDRLTRYIKYGNYINLKFIPGVFRFNKQRKKAYSLYKKWFKIIFKSTLLKQNIINNLKNLDITNNQFKNEQIIKNYKLHFLSLFNLNLMQSLNKINKLLLLKNLKLKNWRSFFTPKLWFFIYLTTFTSIIRKFNIWRLRQQLTVYLTNNYKYRYPNIFLKKAIHHSQLYWRSRLFLNEKKLKNFNKQKKNKFLLPYSKTQFLNDHVSTLPFDLNKLLKRWGRGRPNRYLFKHCYGKILKRERAKINTYFRLNFRYQHRMTRFLFKFKLLSVTNIFRHFCCMFVNIFLRSHLAPTIHEFKFLAKNNCIFLNGLLIKNKHIPVYAGDIIALTVNWFIFKYLKLIKLQLRNQKKQRLAYFYNYFMKKNLLDQVLHKLQKRNMMYKFQDIPYFLETDLTTLTTIMIINPSITYLLANNYWTFNQIYWFSLFQLNWKYIV